LTPLASRASSGNYWPPDSSSPEPGNAKRWPLLAILATQAVLSLALIAHSIVQDEATYVVAGDGEIGRWLHGAQVAPYPKVFSGAPVIYPPLSAAVNGVGGLIATRLMSLCFMLITTAVLWFTARRLFGTRVSLIATALFAATGAVQYLGALATYDAMALMLLALATWCAVRAAGRSGTGRVLTLAAMCAFLLVADATKYASALWDPVVVAVAALADASRRGWREGIITGVVTAAATLLMLAAAILAAGSVYWSGILFSTLNRTVDGHVPASSILASAAGWIGIVAVLAVLGALVLSFSPGYARPVKAMGWVLAAAVFLAPANQARIGVPVSLFKHVAFGAWFAVIPAGYGISAAFSAVVRRGWDISLRAATGWVALLTATTLAVGIFEAQVKADASIGYSPAVVARLRPLLEMSKGMWLGDSPTVLSYYTRTPGVRWSKTDGFTYSDPRTGRTLSGAPAYADAIRHHFFSVVVLLSDRDSGSADNVIVRWLHRVRGYHLRVIGQPGISKPVFVWRYVRGARGPLPPFHRRHRHRRHVRVLGRTAGGTARRQDGTRTR